MRRRTSVLVVATALAPGLAVLGVALAGPPGTTVVTFTPEGVPSPSVATVPADGLLEFRVAADASSPVAIERTASPFIIATTLQPGTSSSPTPVGTSPAEFGYAARNLGPTLLGAPLAPDGPTEPGVLRVTQPAAASSPAPGADGPGGGPPGGVGGGAGGGSSAAGTTPGPSTSTAAAPTSRRSGTAPARGRSGSSRQQLATPPLLSSATPSGAATPGVALPPGALLPLAPIDPSFPPTAAGPAPQLFNPVAAPAPRAGGITTPPAAAGTGTADGTAVTQPGEPPGPASGLAGEAVPARGRGLPLALATVLLLGVGGAVGRVVAAAGRVPRAAG